MKFQFVLDDEGLSAQPQTFIQHVLNYKLIIASREQYPVDTQELMFLYF